MEEKRLKTWWGNFSWALHWHLMHQMIIWTHSGYSDLIQDRHNETSNYKRNTTVLDQDGCSLAIFEQFCSLFMSKVFNQTSNMLKLYVEDLKTTHIILSPDCQHQLMQINLLLNNCNESMLDQWALQTAVMWRTSLLVGLGSTLSRLVASIWCLQMKLMRSYFPTWWLAINTSPCLVLKSCSWSATN